MLFIWLCPLPSVKYHSPRQIVSKKGNYELKYVKNASSILGKLKLKNLHKRTCSVWLNGTFYCVKLIFIWLCPRQFVEYHPQLQFGACHIAPNLAGIARPHKFNEHLKSFVMCHGRPRTSLQWDWRFFWACFGPTGQFGAQKWTWEEPSLPAEPLLATTFLWDI